MISTIFLLLGVAVILYAKYFKNNKEKFKWGMIALSIGLVLYIIMLQVSYLLVFTTEEMIGHNGLERYLPTFFLAFIYWIIASVLKEEKESSKGRNLFYIVIIFSILCVTPLEFIANNSIISGIYEIRKQNTWEQVMTQVDTIKRELEQEQIQEIWMLGSTQEGGDILYENAIRYYLFPEIKARAINAYKQEELEEAKEKLEQEEVSYIYIWSVDNKLEETLGTDLEEKTLYKKTKQENGSFLWEKIE